MKYINSNKLNEIKLDKDNFYVLIDFDNTVTKGDSFSTWRVLLYSGLLGEKFVPQYSKIHADTQPNQNASDEIKTIAYENRFKQFMKLLENCNYNEDINKQAVQETKLCMRNHAKEFFKEMNVLNVPVIIISSSIGNVIKEYLNINNCHYNNIYIYSNYFDYTSQRNHICNVTPYNKNKISFSDNIKNTIKNKKYILLLGNLVEDINMVSKEKLENTVTVGFLDKDIENNLDKYKANFDIVLTNESGYEDVIELIL